jgi:hypothetical protein
MKRVEPTTGDEPRIQHTAAAKRVCVDGGDAPSSSASVVGALARTVVDVVLRSVDEQRAGARYLSHQDELAFAEAVFPWATESVQGRWFCSQRDYVRACLAAGARRLLMSLFREGAPGVTRGVRLGVLAGCAERAVARGSSRPLEVVAPVVIWAQTRPSLSDLSFYIGTTNEPAEAVLRTVRLSQLGSRGDTPRTTGGCPLTAVRPTTREYDALRRLVERGYIDVAVAVLGGLLGGDSESIADAVRPMFRVSRRSGKWGTGGDRELVLRPTITTWTVTSLRRFAEGCRAIGMLDADVRRVWSPEVVTEAISRQPGYHHEPGDLDDAAWLVDFLWGGESGGRAEAHKAMFRLACRTDDTATIERVEKRFRANKQDTCTCLVDAMKEVHMHTLAYLKLHWRRLSDTTPATAVEHVLEGVIVHAFPLSTVRWFFSKNGMCARVKPKHARILEWQAHSFVQSFLGDAECAVGMAELVDRGAVTTECLADCVAHIVSDIRTDVAWAPETIEWAAEITHTDPARLFCTVDAVVLPAYMRASRERAAALHPEWFSSATVWRMMANGDTEALDRLAEHRPELVADVAKDCSSRDVCSWASIAKGDRSAHLLGAEPPAVGADAAPVTALAQPFMPVDRVRPDVVRTTRWLARRGHPAVPLGEHTLIEAVKRFGTPGSRTLAEDIVSAASSCRPSGASAAERAVLWYPVLHDLSESGHADLALRLAAMLHVDAPGLP